jgi:hypothetical protein
VQCVGFQLLVDLLTKCFLKLKNGIEEYLLGCRTLIFFNTSRLVKSNGETPYEQSKGYLDFYESSRNALKALKTGYKDGYQHLRETTRCWVEDARFEQP